METRHNNTVLELDSLLYLYTDNSGIPHLMTESPSGMEEERRSEFEVNFVDCVLARCGYSYTDRNHPITVQVQFRYKGQETRLPILYIYTVENGDGYLFTAHPSNIRKDDVKGFIINLPYHVLHFVGSDISPEKPVEIRARFIRGAESKPFSISDLDDIRSGRKKAHFEDGDGAVIIMQETERQDETYPLVGQVFNPRTKLHEDWRFYSHTGDCYDDNIAHKLEIVAGWAFNKKPENAETNERK